MNAHSVRQKKRQQESQSVLNKVPGDPGNPGGPGLPMGPDLV